MTSVVPESRHRIAVIGGGISGLAAAHRLTELSPRTEVVLLEAADRLGGVLQTERHEDLLIERAADMFITRDPWAIDLCQRIGFTDELIKTNPGARGAYVVHRGRLERVPQGFVLMRPTQVGPILRSRLLSWRGKLRLAAEPFIPARREAGDESLAAFARRRLGREAYEHLVQPLIGGIYTADPERLSMQAALRQFVEMEQQHGSLLRAALRQKKDRQEASGTSGARYGMFVAPREGMRSLVEKLASRLPTEAIQLNMAVRDLRRDQSGWLVVTEGKPAERFDGVIVATPAPVAARLLDGVDRQLGGHLAQIEYAGVTVAALVLRKDQVRLPANASGYVTPQIERRKVLALSFSSLKFAGRAPDDELLIRVFIGGAMQSELNELPDDAIRQLVRNELREMLAVQDEPRLWRIVRWQGAMPQYHVGHLDRVAEIESAVERLPNLELAGNAYHGVGIPFCIHSGEQAAERLKAVLNENCGSS